MRLLPAFLPLVFLLPGIALAAEQFVTLAEVDAKIDNLQTNVNHVWTMVAAALVAFMQAGFLLLEAGMVRSKNSINVAQKNITDFIASIICFYLFGFMMMFGTSAGGWIGWDADLLMWNLAEDWNYTFFVFQVVFVGTAATILSGAVAERMKFSVYVIMAVIVSALIYPIFGHWAWGNLLNGDNTSYLIEKGFIDFAGSTVVHSIGGWVALAGVIVIGPRIGKFNEDGSVNPIHGHSYALATLGGIILWVGWIGFNGGSTTVGDPSFAHIISNTMLAAAFGGLVSMLLGRFHDGLFRPDRSINGVLGGLVGITAGCDAVTTYGAITIGMTSGFVVYYSAWLLEHKFKLDDAVGAVPVHGFCGAWGTIMVGVLTAEDSLAAPSRLEQISIQAQGALFAFLWAFTIAFVLFKILDKIIGIRVSAEDEIEGLNTSEHGTTLGTGLLQARLKEIVFGDGDLTQRLDSTTGDESAEVAYLFNEFMDRIQSFIRSIKGNTHKLMTASQELSEVATAMAASSEELTAQSSEVASSTSKVSEKMGSSSSTITGVSGKIASISGNARQMSDNLTSISGAVEGLSQAISEIVSKASDASSVSGEASQMSKEAETAVATLREASEKIGALLTIIRDIADKTNLLALNATIEAARAGEAGKGFSVVANEVKSLASQTAQATRDIEEHIAMIQSSSGNVANVITGITDVIGHITSAIDVITKSTHLQQESAHNIEEAVRISSGGTSEIASSVSEASEQAGQVATDIEHVAEEAQVMADNVNAFSDEARQTSKNASVVEKSAKELNEIGAELEKSVKQFKTD